MPTGIFEIHGAVPRNEFADRGLEVGVTNGYIPYLSLTKGEMKLALLAEQAKIYSKAFPEFKAYRQAANMLENALRQGVSRGVNFVGSLDNPVLLQVARDIQSASRQQQPASRAGIFGRPSIGRGIGDLVDSSKRLFTCLQTAGADQGKRHNCYVNYEIEKIFNAKIVDASHHVMYKNIRPSDIFPSVVKDKARDHRVDIQGLALVGELEDTIMDLWVETSIIKKNSEKNAGALGSMDSSVCLRDTKQAKIGVIDPITAGIITTCIVAAITAAAKMLTDMRSQKAYAMAQAKGFGTPGNGPEDDDFDGPNVEGSNTGLLIGGAVAAYFLLTDN